jgi:hypothetical protein
VSVIKRIGHKKKARFGFAVAVLNRHHAGRGGVPKNFPAHANFVMSDNWQLFR